jgi:hypothetical protein
MKSRKDRCSVSDVRKMSATHQGEYKWQCFLRKSDDELTARKKKKKKKKSLIELWLTVFGNVTTCNLIDGYQIFEKKSLLSFYCLSSPASTRIYREFNRKPNPDARQALRLPLDYTGSSIEKKHHDARQAERPYISTCCVSAGSRKELTVALIICSVVEKQV